MKNSLVRASRPWRFVSGRGADVQVKDRVRQGLIVALGDSIRPIRTALVRHNYWLIDDHFRRA